MEYRKFKLSDYESAIALWKVSDGVGLRGADSLEGIEKYLKRNPGLSFVAECDGEIIGTIMSGHDGKRGYVQHLAVSQRHQNQGIGTHLISLVLQALKSEGIVKSHIHVFAHNDQGKQFWLKRGWQYRTDLIVCSFINSNDKNA